MIDSTIAEWHSVLASNLFSVFYTSKYALPTMRALKTAFDPRGILADFGTHVDAGVEITVWDSTAEVRYLVLPERPSGTESLSETELEALVTRNGLIGTALV